MEQIILSVITWCIQYDQGVRPSLHGYWRGMSCLTHVIFFYDQVTHLVNEGNAVDVVYIGFSKAFDTITHSICLKKLEGLDCVLD